MRLTNRGSSSGKRARCRWGDRACPMTRQARRSETPSRVQTWLTTWRLRGGLSSFPRALFADRVVQGRVGHQLLQSQVLLLECLQPLGRVQPQAAVRLPPAVARLLADTQLLADLGACAAPGRTLPRPDGASQCAWRNVFHGVRWPRSGAGAMPRLRRIRFTVFRPISWPRLANAPGCGCSPTGDSRWPSVRPVRQSPEASEDDRDGDGRCRRISAR